MENNLKHALITGATSGIGYELAKLFALNNYNLVLVARNKENLDLTAREMQELNPSVHAHTIPVDLFEDAAAQKVYDETKRLGIDINVLVNDAGQGEWGPFSETDLQRELDIIHLNVVSLVSLTKFYLKEMVQRNEGKILQLASSVSKAPSPLLSVYAATKAFVLSFTEALIEEVKETSITITALQPYATDTDFFHKAKMENTVTYRESLMSTPEEVAKAGFEGLMNGEATVLPGVQNKVINAMNIVTPDTMIAKNMAKQNEVSEKTSGRINTKHTASSRERKSIQKINGDF